MQGGGKPLNGGIVAEVRTLLSARTSETELEALWQKLAPLQGLGKVLPYSAGGDGEMEGLGWGRWMQERHLGNAPDGDHGYQDEEWGGDGPHDVAPHPRDVHDAHGKGQPPLQQGAMLPAEHYLEVTLHAHHTVLPSRVYPYCC